MRAPEARAKSFEYFAGKQHIYASERKCCSNCGPLLGWEGAGAPPLATGLNKTEMAHKRRDNKKITYSRLRT